MAAMVRANDERGQQQRAATQQQSQAMLQQREAEERRHEESMTALKALIAGRQTAAPETTADGRRDGNKGRLTPFPADEISKSSDCRGRLGRKSRPETGAGAPPASVRAGSATTPLAGAKLDLSGDLFSVFRARLAADGGQKPGKRRREKILRNGFYGLRLRVIAQ